MSSELLLIYEIHLSSFFCLMSSLFIFHSVFVSNYFPVQNYIFIVNKCFSFINTNKHDDDNQRFIFFLFVFSVSHRYGIGSVESDNLKCKETSRKTTLNGHIGNFTKTDM